jgi:hypothetical protein
MTLQPSLILIMSKALQSPPQRILLVPRDHIFGKPKSQTPLNRIFYMLDNEGSLL